MMSSGPAINRLKKPYLEWFPTFIQKVVTRISFLDLDITGYDFVDKSLWGCRRHRACTWDVLQTRYPFVPCGGKVVYFDSQVLQDNENLVDHTDLRIIAGRWNIGDCGCRQLSRCGKSFAQRLIRLL